MPGEHTQQKLTQVNPRRAIHVSQEIVCVCALSIQASLLRRGLFHFWHAGKAGGSISSRFGSPIVILLPRNAGSQNGWRSRLGKQGEGIKFIAEPGEKGNKSAWGTLGMEKREASPFALPIVPRAFSRSSSELLSIGSYEVASAKEGAIQATTVWR